MPTKTGRGRETALHKANTDDIITSRKDLKDADPENKAKYLKRLKKEDAVQTKLSTKEECYLVVQGNKVLIKFKNQLGSGYTRYFYNKKRHPDRYAELLKDGEVLAPISMENWVVMPLKSIDYKPYKRP